MTDDVARQYAAADPLLVRMRTHELYSEPPIDLDEVCHTALDLEGDEALLDVGCGPGRFLAYIAAAGRRGRLTGFDQSAAMVAEVAKQGIEAVQGDIQALPFDDGSFDRVIARHMLYHVPDIPAALAEIRRVLKPAGFLLATTNSNRSLPRILDLIQDMLAAFGSPEWERPDARFCVENALEFLEAAGFTVEERIIENALVIHDADPVVAYCVSTLPSLEIAQDLATRVEMEAWLAAEAARRLAAHGGVWRDPKRAGVYRGRSL